MPKSEFCVVDDKGKKFRVIISEKPTIPALLGGARKLKGFYYGYTAKIWIRDRLPEDLTDRILRHEIAHSRQSIAHKFVVESFHGGERAIEREVEQLAASVSYSVVPC